VNAAPASPSAVLLAPPSLPRANRLGLVRRVPPALIGPVPRVAVHVMGQPLPPRPTVLAPAQDGVAEFREGVHLVREAEVVLFERPDGASGGAQTWWLSLVPPGVIP
jgi:hypothetical protein